MKTKWQQKYIKMTKKFDKLDKSKTQDFPDFFWFKICKKKNKMCPFHAIFESAKSGTTMLTSSFLSTKIMFTLLVILFIIKLYAPTDISKVRNLSSFYSRQEIFFLWGLRYTSTGFLWVLSIWRDTSWVTNIHKRFILPTTNLQVCSFLDDNNWYNCNKNPQHIKTVWLHGSFQPIWYSAFSK